MNIVLLGAPGSGKGTQAARLRDGLGLAHVASGDLFRDHLGRGSELGQLARGYMDAGKLVPDDVTIGMIRERLDQPDAASGVLFDGFPRTVAQATALDAMLRERGERVEGAILIDVDEEELVSRLSGRLICRECGASFHIRFAPFKACPEGRCDGEFLYQREDDRPEAVRVRLETYRRQTEPVIGFYEDAGLLERVDGQGDVVDVTERMEAAVRAIVERSDAGQGERQKER